MGEGLAWHIGEQTGTKVRGAIERKELKEKLKQKKDTVRKWDFWIVMLREYIKQYLEYHLSNYTHIEKRIMVKLKV